MFIGHNAAGFASKRIAPRVSLGWLMAAPMLLDLLWPILLLLGIEHVRIVPTNGLTPLDFYDYPWTHSLLMACVWGIVYGGIYWLRSRDLRAWLVLALGVISHWVFDLFVHNPDLPLWPGGPKVGLGLWNHPLTETSIEAALFVIGVAIYARMTRARDRIGSIAFWAFVVFLIVTHVSSVFGPPPPTVKAIAWMAMLMWLFPLWAWWFDSHREVRG